MEHTLSIRGMGDDSFVVVTEDDEARSAWPPWKHLLEDLADAKHTPTNLKLAYKNIGDAGSYRLAELLQNKLCNLVFLDLSCTSIGSGGAIAIARTLGSHTALKSLDISFNAVTDAGCTAFAQSLATNSYLESLSLHACLIGDRGAAALADALKSNRTLTALSLRQNYIADSGAVALSRVVVESASLSVLDVQSNCYRAEGRKALDAAYSSNTRVARSMPLSYHTESDLAEGQKRLAMPPRSLVSVDSAMSSTKSSVHETPTRTSSRGTSNTTSDSHRKDHSASRTPDIHINIHQLTKKSSHTEGSPNTRNKSASGRSLDVNGLTGSSSRGQRQSFLACVIKCCYSVGKSRITMLRVALVVAIVFVTFGVWFMSSQMQDIDTFQGIKAKIKAKIKKHAPDTSNAAHKASDKVHTGP